MAHQLLHGFRLTCLAIPLLAAACRSDLPTPHASRGVSGSDDPPRIELFPPRPLDAASRVLRAEVHLGGASALDPSRLVLIHGEVGQGHLRQLEKNEISKTLAERIVPALSWIASDDGGDEVTLMLAPTEALIAGDAYAIACGEPSFSVPIVIAPDDEARLLSRVWPPEDGSGSIDFGVWCDRAPLPFPLVERAFSLDPFGPLGALRAGVDEGVGGACVRFESFAPSSDRGPFVAPPAIAISGETLLLDPRAWVVDEDLAPIVPAPLICEEGEIAFGPSCAIVYDDRLVARSPDAALLWNVHGAGLDTTFVTRASDPFVIAQLSPASLLDFQLVTADAAGARSRFDRSITTRAAMAHVVINEVLANAIGAEPDQEWVELINDGLAAASLDGYVLTDIGGETALPSATLAPGQLALIVNEDFVEDDELDVPPAEGTLILRVPKLGKSGLSNEGEPLKLLDAKGEVVSRFPAAPKPKAGISVGRTTPWAPYGLASGFVLQTSGATPGAANTNEAAD